MTLEELYFQSKLPISTYMRIKDYKGASVPLIKLKKSNKLIINPIWNNPNDSEGKLYNHYRKNNSQYNDIYVRKPIVKMLQSASTALPDSWYLVIRAGHRPLEVQSLLFDEVKSKLRIDNPSINETKITELTRNFVADPSQKFPAHCCGAAVDVDVFDKKTNNLVDFGSPINFEGEISQLHSNLVTDTQHKNRMILLLAMLSAGFASDYHEWWHYSYGDSQWAVFHKQTEPLFNLIEI